MRRRDLSDEELTTVINLKRAGSSWVKIQRETGVNRRTAKRAYEKWLRSRAIEALNEARKDVAAQAFREHMDSLVTLASSFVMNLGVPHLAALMDKNSEEFFSWLLDQDLLLRYISSLETKEAYARFSPRLVDPQSYRREKGLLFDSLKVHTRENARLWKAWDEWKEARNNCGKVLRKLRKETIKVVNNFLNQERQTNLLHSIKEESGEGDPVKLMAEGILGEIWKAILRDKLEQEGPWFQMVSGGRATPQLIHVKSRDERLLTFIGDANTSLAENVTRILELAASNLCKGELVKSLQKEVRAMEKAREELREMLNPVRLRPMILRTRCELCPA